MSISSARPSRPAPSPATLALAALLFSACPSAPPPAVPTEDPATATVPAESPKPSAPAFDPATVPEEDRKDAFEKIRALVEELNGIIRRKDFEAWRARLSDEYAAYFSSPDVLAELSKAQTLQRQGIRLSTLLDYFLYVVYPSRQFDRVDDIEFIAADRVKAITVAPKGERLVLYELAKYGDTWKISIGRQP